MTASDHLIDRLKIQLDVPDRRKAEYFIEKISQLCHEKLPAAINEVIEEFGLPADTHLRIDKILVDAGLLQEATFEEELIEHLTKALRTSLHRFQQAASPTSTVIPAARQQLELLAFLLEFGHYPWWATQKGLTNESLESLWLQILEKPQTEIRKQLKRLLQLPKAQTRLIRQLSPATIRLSVWSLLNKDEGDDRFKFLQALTQVVKKQYPDQEADGDIWLTGLIQLLHNPPGETSLQSLWIIQNQQLATKIATPTKILMQQLLADFSTWGQLPLEPFLTATKNYPSENPLPQHKHISATGQEQNSTAPQQPTQMLERAALSATEMEPGLRNFLQRFPKTARQLLLELFQKTDGAPQVIEQINLEILQETIAILFPTLAPDIRAIIQAIVKRIATIHPQQDLAPRIWQNALKYLLEHPYFPLSEKGFMKVIIPDLAENLGEPTVVIRQLLKRMPPPDATTSIANRDILSDYELAVANAEQALLSFLASGQLPEHQKATLADMEQSLRALILRYPQKARQQLLELSRKKEVVPRLSRQFGFKLIQDTIEALFPTLAPGIRSLIEAIEALLRKEYPAQQAKPLLWQYALTYLLEHPVAPVSNDDFIKTIVPDLAKSLKAPIPVIRKLLKHLPKKEVLGSSATTGTPSFSDNEPTSSTAELAARLILESGQVPDNNTASMADIEQALLEFVRRQPQKARELLRQLSHKKEGIHHLARPFGSKLLVELIEVLFPTLAPGIRIRIKAIEKILTQEYPTQQATSILWQLALEYLLEQPVVPVSDKDFIHSIIPDLAKRLGTPHTRVQQLLGSMQKGEEQKLELPTSRTKERQDSIEKMATTPKLEHFRQYLESGRLPEGITKADLEENFQSFLKLAPQKAKQFLLEIHQKTAVAEQLFQLFETKMLIAIMDALYPELAARLSSFIRIFSKELATNYPGRAVDALLWKNALSFLLSNPDSPALVSRIAESSIPDIANDVGEPTEEIHRILKNLFSSAHLEGIQKESFVDQHLSDLPKTDDLAHSPAGQAFYFLEWSRLPTGTSTPMASLEEAFSNQLDNAPAQSRQLLLALNGKLNLAERLIQHFSLKTLQKTIQTLFPGSWKDLNLVLHDVVKFPLTSEKTKETAVPFIWGAALRILLRNPSETINFPVLLQHLIPQLQHVGLVKLKIPISTTTVSSLLKAGLQPISIQYLIQAFAQIKDEEQQALEQEIDKWQKENREKNAAGRSTKIALDTILYRLEHKQVAWWESAEKSEDTLVFSLAQATEQELRAAMQAIWSAPFRENWIPQLSDKTMQQLFKVLWADYAEISELMLQVFSAAAQEFGLIVDKRKFQMALLERAQTSNPINSQEIFHLILQRALDQSHQSEQFWKKALLRQTDPGITSGDIRFHRIRELVAGLGEPSEQDDPNKKAVEEQVNSPQAVELSRKKNIPTYADLLRQDLNLLNQFLQWGTLPAQSGALQNAAALEQLLIRLIDKHSNLVLPLLINAFSHKENAQRIGQLFSVKTLHATAALLWKTQISTMLELWGQLLDRLQEQAFQMERNRLNKHFFSYIFHLAGTTTPEKFAVLPFTEGLVSLIAEKEEIPIAILLEQLRTVQPGRSQNRITMLLAEIDKRRDPEALKASSKQSKQEPAPIQDSPILVANAGLVILAPYLPRYFGTLNLLDNQQFIDAAAAERAVHLLQYLASNQKETPEHLLVFNKVLCGIPINTPVGPGFEPTNAEMELSAFLLNTVLQNWEMMKKSSIANLQGAFLLREGLLREKEDKWLLYIEKKGFDVVLDYLPWTISQIVLPWMDKRIEVEWKKKT